MIRSTLRTLLVSTALLVGVQTAHAEVLTFEGIAPAGSYVEAPASGIGGYVFSGGAYVFSSNYYLGGQWGPGPYTGNGTDVLVSVGTSEFTSASNTPFSVTSLSLAAHGTSGPVFSLTITGNRADGSSVEYFQVISPNPWDRALHKVVFSDFTDMTSVSIVGSNGAVKIDNIVLNAPDTESPISPVPEPATYALLLAGLALTGAFARRKRIG